MSSPTQRTLKLLRDAGMTAAVVEHWNPHSRIRQDLFGVLDVVALDSRQVGVYGVQATSGPHHAERVKKLLAAPLAKLWVQCGNRLAVYSWVKKGPRGGRKLWVPRIEELTLGLFPEVLTERSGT